MRPLDFVRTPKGNIALVTVVHEGSEGTTVSIDPVDTTKSFGEKTAWWEAEELKVIGSLPFLVASSLASSTEQRAVNKYFAVDGVKPEAVFEMSFTEIKPKTKTKKKKGSIRLFEMDCMNAKLKKKK